MPSYPIHSNIKHHLLKQIKEAKILIFASVAWFTDTDLFQALIEKARQGVLVELILNNDYGKVAYDGENDSINFSNHTDIDFFDLEDAGGKVFLLGGNHNKFCVIDLHISISGSYNWTYGANNKDEGLESIDIYTENYQHALEKAVQFKKLLDTASPLMNIVLGKEDLRSDPDSVILPIQFSKQIDKNLFKLVMADNSVFYVDRKTISDGCLYKEGNEILISEDYTVNRIGNLNWLTRREENPNRQNSSSGPSMSDITEPVDDLPF